jgi:hypothetical protein
MEFHGIRLPSRSFAMAARDVRPCHKLEAGRREAMGEKSYERQKLPPINILIINGARVKCRRVVGRSGSKRAMQNDSDSVGPSEAPR